MQFAREHGRQYNSAAEVHLRRQIFNENYNSMQEHNARSNQVKLWWSNAVFGTQWLSFNIFISKLGLNFNSWDRFEAGEETWNRKVKTEWNALRQIQRSILVKWHNDGNQRWPHSMTTPWKRLLLSWHQVKISFLGLTILTGPFSNFCRRPACVWQHNCFCWHGWWSLLGKACWGTKPFMLD